MNKDISIRELSVGMWKAVPSSNIPTDTATDVMTSKKGNKLS